MRLRLRRTATADHLARHEPTSDAAGVRRSLLLALVLPLLAACGGTAASPEPSSPLGGTWTIVSVPGFEISERLEAPTVQFRSDGHIVAVTACHELLLPFTLEGEQVSVGELEVPEGGSDCTQRERRIDAALAAVLLSADTLVGGLPGDRLTISGPLGEISLAQPASQTEEPAEPADV